MKMRIQVVIEHDVGEADLVQEVACVQRGPLQPETLGLTLAESKAITQGIQRVLIPYQVADFVDQAAYCPDCGQPRRRKGQHEIVVRSLFGRMRVPSPRFYVCSCQPRDCQSCSPVAELLPERTTPELRYLAATVAASESYERTVAWLGEVLPLEDEISTMAVRRHMTEISERLDGALSAEESTVEGCPRDWAALPDPQGPLTVGLDGGYVPARRGECRQATAFEAIIGKSTMAEGTMRRFAFVPGDGDKARQRLVTVLQAQGMQLNQHVTFLPDGGDAVRDLPLYLYPEAEYLLDWFHITMRLTTMGQTAKGVHARDHPRLSAELQDTLESLKWYLWHGNVFRAMQLVDDLEFDLDLLDGHPAAHKLLKAVHEFGAYIRINHKFITNYGERYRYGETISTAFVESTANQVMSKRMAKKQQMRWTRRGAHRVLQVRTQVLDGELRRTFCRWYPGMLADAGDEAAA